MKKAGGNTPPACVFSWRVKYKVLSRLFKSRLFGEAFFHEGLAVIPGFAFGFLVAIDHFVLLAGFCLAPCGRTASAFFHEGSLCSTMQGLAGFADSFAFAVAGRCRLGGLSKRPLADHERSQYDQDARVTIVQ